MGEREASICHTFGYIFAIPTWEEKPGVMPLGKCSVTGHRRLLETDKATEVTERGFVHL